MVKGERMVCMGFLLWEFLKNFFFFVGYISTGTAFPKPLSAKEEEMYFDLWKSGDMEARNILIERNLRLVVHIAKKYSHSHDVDDLISIGSIGLIKAVSTYDNTKGNRFATYAARCIQNEILMHLRSSKKLQNEVSLEEPIGRDKEGNAISLIDILENEDADTFEKVDLKFRVKQLYENVKNVLTDRERVIIGLRYGLGNGKEKTQKEIAKMLNISRSYVSRIEKKAIEKLMEESN